MSRIKEQRNKTLKYIFYKYKVIQKKYKKFENFLEDLWNIPGYEPCALASKKLKFFPKEFEFRLKGLKLNHVEKWKKLGAEFPMNNNPGYQKIYGCFKNYKNHKMFEWEKISDFIKDYKNIEGYDRDLFFDNLLLLKRKDKNIGWNVKNCYWDLKTNKSKKIKTEETEYIFIHMDGTIVEWNKSIALFYKEKENFSGQIAFGCKKRRRKVTLGWRYFSVENWEKIKKNYGTPYYFEAEALYQYLVRNNYDDMEIDFEDFLCRLPEIENLKKQNFNDNFSEAAISYLVANNKTKKVFYKEREKNLKYIINISNEIILNAKKRNEKNILNMLENCKTIKSIETLNNFLKP